MIHIKTDDFWKLNKELELLERDVIVNKDEVEISFRVSKEYPTYYIKILEKGYEVKCARGDDTHIKTNIEDLWDYVAYDYLEKQEELKFQNNKKTRKRI